ncbi:variable surface protein [Plasmodium gonderi]|uniref:Variable surface protein n=1 Tax=Plasmodium gonderi TaxID=77519 RepID=A0A1Y1JY64_PLAGO|nr:variable surface protein [Plasmodium gonderi]GAW84704.1 variable surface protein [Plasmodium gonderi]
MGEYRELIKKNLPSYKIIEQLLKGKDISELESLICSSVNSSDILEEITNFNASIQVGYNNIKKECTTSNNQKCCRALNYYLDFVTANIYLSQIMGEFKPDLIVQLEEPWITRRSSNNYKCDRENDKNSILKRCIIKEIYDFHYDKDYLNENLKETNNSYDIHLNKKWCSIIRYVESSIKVKEIIITINGDQKTIKYADLPFKYKFLKSNNFINDENDDLIISIEEHRNALDNNHGQIGNMSNEHIQTKYNNDEKVIQSKNVFFVKYFLIYCYIITISPLGSYIRKKIMKKKYFEKYICKNTEDSFLPNTDNNKFNITYNS